MHAEHWTKRTELKPTREEFLVLRIGRIAIACGTIAEETSRVGIPIGDAGEGEIQSGGDLVAQDLPGVLNVARPGDGAVALLARVGRAGQNDHSLLIGGGPLPLVNARRVHQRIGVVNRITRPHRGGVAAETHVVDFRFRGVRPPAVGAFGE